MMPGPVTSNGSRTDLGTTGRGGKTAPFCLLTVRIRPLRRPERHNRMTTTTPRLFEGSPPWVQECLALALQFLQSWGIPADFDASTLRAIESRFEEGRAVYAGRADHTTAIFGAYVGESLRYVFGGQWAETDLGWAIEIDVNGSKIVALPLVNVRRFVVDSSADSFSMFYDNVARQVINHSC
jgi:hypothetical protein